MFESLAMAPSPFVAEGTVLSVSCPGGMARQFRVQVASDETPSGWTHAGSFANRSTALARAEELTRTGSQARVVSCQTMPTAG